MADNKSVLEEALLEAQQLEEAVKSNAKEILAATMKQEIEELVRESLNEEEEDDLVDTDEEEVSLDFIDDDDDEEYEDQEEEEFLAPDETDAMVSMGIELDTDGPALDLTQASDDEILKVFKSMGAEDGIIVTQDGDTIDIEDQETGTEYKIELAESKLRNNLLITEDYDKEDSMNESYVDDGELGEMDEFDLDEPMYEISLEDEMSDKDGEEDIEELQEDDYSDSRWAGHYKDAAEDDYSQIEKLKKDARYDAGKRRDNEFREGTWGHNKREYKRHMDSAGQETKSGDVDHHYLDYETHEGKPSDEEMGEASRTYGFGSKKGRGLRKAITNNRNLEFPMNESTRNTVNKIITTAKKLQTENKQFRDKNKEYRQALKVFRNKLNEVAVFNANLAYSTKLFTQHTTTKKEKVNILRRFDGVTTLNESKNLFSSLTTELNSKVSKLNESVQKTITKTPSGGSSVNLIENKTYESPQITRMRDIMNKL